MKSAVESLNPTRVKLSVEVPFDELKPSLDAAYRKIGQQISVPGFRKGKVPSAIIDQRVGRNAVLVEAVNDALPELYTKALEDNEITPLSQPELQVDDLEDGTNLAFTAELDVLPKIELPEYHGLEAEVEELSVDDSDVDQQMENLRQRFGTLQPVDRPAHSGDFVTIDLSAAKDGEPIPEAQAAGMSYQIGSGTMLEGLDDALAGLSADEEATFESTLVGGEYRDQPVDVTVKVSSVKEQELPELDDEFAQTASEFDTVAELRADLRDQVTRSARLTQAAAARDAVLQRLLSLVDVPLPDGAVEQEKANRSEQINEQLSYAGMTMADYLESEGQTAEEFAEQMDERVREAMVAQFVLDQIAQVEQMGVDEGDLTQQLMRRAQQAGVSPEQYIKHAMDHNHLPEIVGEVRRGKALAHVVESAAVKDKAGTVVELRTLMPDGTYAEPDEEDAAATAAADAAAPSTDAASQVVFAGDYTVVDEGSK
ncbi:MAG: trigger factor [Nocardioidaceae bacterium]